MERRECKKATSIFDEACLHSMGRAGGDRTEGESLIEKLDGRDAGEPGVRAVIARIKGRIDDRKAGTFPAPNVQ